MYSNCRGCDGERVYYDGCSLIALNGKIIAQGKAFSLQDVEVITATIDLSDVCSYRGALQTYQYQGAKSENYSRLTLDEYFCSDNPSLAVSQPITVTPLTPEEEISLGPACWLWDHLRRSGMSGFFLPLSGGECMKCNSRQYPKLFQDLIPCTTALHSQNLVILFL